MNLFTDEYNRGMTETSLASKIDAFFTQFKHQTYKMGEILVRADDNPPGIFYLKKGIVREYAISKKGDELVVNIFKPIAFFPMSWAINDTPNSYYFEAVSDIEVWKTPKEKTVEFIKNNPDILYDLLSRVYRGTDGLLMRMAYLMSGNAYTSLIAELLISAKRFGSKGKDGVIEVKLSGKDLATHAGMTRETVSRELAILKKKRLVGFNKGMITISNIQKLEDELASL